MAPRTSWKGHLKLSLISVPVKAFTANNTSETIRLNQLHKDCHSRVKYQKVCPEHGELKSTEIVSGYEYAKDQYVVIDPSELDLLRPESDKSVRIDGFVDIDAIDPMYLSGRTYYLLPDGIAGDKPYALLLDGMVKEEVYAIAQVVLSGREQLVLVRPVENLLTMSILNVSKKVKGIDEFSGSLEEQDMTRDELKLTKTLIEASILEDFDYAKYEDAYVEKLTELIKKKVDGEEVVQVPDREEPKIINLMEALKKSVAEAQTGRKMASSVKAGKKTKKKATTAAKKKKGRRKKTG